MTPLLVIAIVLLAGALVALGATNLRIRHRAPRAAPPSPRRILFPFTADALSPGALDAALRLAAAEHATLVPAFLARVSLTLPLDASLPRQCGVAMPLLEAVEQRAAAFGVPVDARIERGRDYRHALRRTLDHERYDRLVVAAETNGGGGLHSDEVAWLLDHAPGELVILRARRGEGRAAMPPSPRSGRRPRARGERRRLAPLARR
jgi:hypothetical protein